MHGVARDIFDSSSEANISLDSFWSFGNNWVGENSVTKVAHGRVFNATTTSYAADVAAQRKPKTCSIFTFGNSGCIIFKNRNILTASASVRKISPHKKYYNKITINNQIGWDYGRIFEL